MTIPAWRTVVERSGWFGGLVGRDFHGGSFVVIRTVFWTIATSPADDEFAAHEVLVVEHGNSPLGLLHTAHFNEGESFGLLGAGIDHHFGAGDETDSAEEILQFAFGGGEIEIAYVKSWRGDLGGRGATSLTKICSGGIATSRSGLPTALSLRFFLALWRTGGLRFARGRCAFFLRWFPEQAEAQE